MKKIVGIRLKPGGKIYDFDCGAFVLNEEDKVIVETDQGLAIGVVAVPPVRRNAESLNKPLKKIYRLANQKDLCQIEKNLKSEKLARTYGLFCIKKLGLEMNLFFVESSFDGSKLTFFFTSDSRVDFRQLVKMLVKEFGVRIEMKQVGIRNKAKMCGGIGRCGRELCCSSFLEKFEPISIRMAKEQKLSLNPTKISGQCGRLMCCLTFENETYRHLRSSLPQIGHMVDTDRGKAKVIRHNVICNRVVVRLNDGHEFETEVKIDL